MSISDQLRDAITASGKPITTIAREAGITQPALWRFMQGEGVTTGTADKLADYFGLKLCRDKKSKPKKKASG